MAKIHGVVYILVGLLFTIWSLMLNIKNHYQKMTLFVIAGILLILYGVLRIISK